VCSGIGAWGVGYEPVLRALAGALAKVVGCSSACRASRASKRACTCALVNCSALKWPGNLLVEARTGGGAVW